MICKHNAPPPKGEIGPRVSYLSRMLRHSFNEAIKKEGLFSGQQDIILLLMHNPGATISDVATNIGISAASVSVSIKRLEKAGFVTKKQSKSDARITQLFLTEKGSAVPEHIKTKMQNENKKLTTGMTEEEIEMLSNLLDRAINNLKGGEE